MDPETAQTFHPPPSYASTPLLPQSGEKGATSAPPARIVGYPGYPGYDATQAHGGPLPAPGIHEPRRRRSRTRRFVVRTVHMLMLLAVFIMLFPTFLRGVARITQALNGWRGSADVFLGSPDLPSDCKKVLDWTVLEHPPHDLLDEELFLLRDHLAARTSLKLPVSSDLLYFIGRGTLSHGLVRILDDGEDENDVNVTVTYLYDAEHLLEKAKVCLLEQEKHHNGVGIFTPHWNHRHDHRHRTFFLLDIHLPAHKASSLLHIRGFKTDLPLFRHSTADLADSVHFDSVSLSTSNVGIDSESLSADHAALKSSNGVITGNYTVKDKLEIRTSNSPIIASINMINRGGDKATNVTLITSNSPLHSNISLIAATDNETGGSFRVFTKTSNSPLNVNFTSAPVDSLLHFDGATSNSPAHLSLHSTYEGSFALRSSAFFQPRVEAREDVEDPAGKGRRRNVEIRSIRRGTTEGKVTWESSGDRELGNVELRTSNMPVTLAL